MIDEEKAEDLLVLYKAISSQNCPLCGKEKNISVLEIRLVIGVIFISHNKKHYYVGCRKCLNLEILKANVISVFFGWWSIPYGPFHTIYAIFKNLQKIFSKTLNTDFLKFIAKYEEVINVKIIAGENEFTQFLRNPSKETAGNSA